MTLRMLLAMLRRHSLMPLLVMLQVVVACAILCNVLFLTWHQLQPMLAPSGIDTRDLVLIDQLTPAHGVWTTAQVEAGTEALREVPGVEAVSPAVGLPMVSSVLNVAVLQGPTGAKIDVNSYVGEGLAKTLDIRLVAGRDFLPSEYRDFLDSGKVVQSVIITQALARQLFGTRDPLGQIVRDPNIKRHQDPGWRVVGIAAHLLRSQVSEATGGRADDTILLPARIVNFPFLTYAVRVKPGALQFALPGLRRAIEREFGPLMQVGSKASVETYDVRRGRIFAHRRAAVGLLAGIVIVVLIVTMVGIMGLTGFWVQRRTRQIGIRRALGARRHDILAWFLAENALITAVGIVFGMALAYGGNLWLMQHYELERLPWQYLPIGAACMLLLGQLAVLAPALRATRVPPVMAMRAV